MHLSTSYRDSEYPPDRGASACSLSSCDSHRSRPLRLGVCWVIVLALIQGVATTAASSAQGNDTLQEPLTATQVAQQFGPSVVLIEAEFPGGQTYTGSGFFVSSQRTIATSLHLVDGAKSITVRIEGKRFDANHIRAFDVEQDLVIIHVRDPRVEAESVEALELGNSVALQRGDPIYVISNPLGLVGTVSEGILSAWREPRSDEDDDLERSELLRGLPKGRLLQMSASASPGSSGAPVFNSSGQVVGVVAGGMAGGTLALNFAVAIEELVPLLTRDGGWDLSSLRESVNRQRLELAQPYLREARYQFESEQFDDAIASLDHALVVFPSFEEALILKGGLLVLIGRTSEAEQTFHTLTETNPESAEAWEQSGLFALRHLPSERGSIRPGKPAPMTPRLAHATEAFEKALEIDPWRAEAAFGLAEVYTELGRLENARELAAQAADADREHVDARVLLGAICLLQDEPRAAEEALQDALWLDRDNPDVHYLLAAAYHEMGELASSSRHTQRYLDLIREER